MNGGGDYSSMRHLFDGYGLLSKVRLEGGKAWGSQRYIDTQAYKMYRERGEQCNTTYVSGEKADKGDKELT